mmetsp:Transcript_5708/g.13110  ORF Transcript_5708/g.13110 Transcript_5708/m.13110 type:complete len:281 (-) Transcript_5708:361-1203(-)
MVESSWASTRAAARRMRASSTGAAKPSQFAAACSTSTVSCIASSQVDGPFGPCRPSMENFHFVCSRSSSARSKIRSFCATPTSGISEGLLETRFRMSFCRSKTSLFSFMSSRRFEVARSFGVSAASSSSLESASFPSAPSRLFGSFVLALVCSLSKTSFNIWAFCWASPTSTAADAVASAVSLARPASPSKVLAMVLHAKLDISIAPATDCRVLASSFDCCNSLLESSVAFRPLSEMISVHCMRSRVVFTACLVMPSAVLIFSSNGTRSVGTPIAHLATL